MTVSPHHDETDVFGRAWVFASRGKLICWLNCGPSLQSAHFIPSVFGTIPVDKWAQRDEEEAAKKAKKLKRVVKEGKSYAISAKRACL